MTQRRCPGGDRRLPGHALARACPWHKTCSFAWSVRFPRGMERREHGSKSNPESTAIQAVGVQRDVQQVQ